METKKQWGTRGSDSYMEYDSSYVEFAELLASKFYNHMTMDQYTKNALWIYWTRGVKTYKEYEEEWAHELNNDHEEPCWNNDGLCNGRELPRMDRVGYMTYFKDYEWYEDLVDGKLKEEVLKQNAIYEGSWGNATRGVMNFCAWLKRYFRNFHELDYELLVKIKEYWWKEGMMKKVSRMMIMASATLSRFGITHIIMKRKSNTKEIGEEYVAVKEHEYDDLTRVYEDACRAY
ncbi:hypothetical protein Tco_0966723 [Tanacetum coccineum]